MSAEVGEDGTGLLKVGDVATMLGVSEPTVWRMIRRGDLETITVGARSRRISPAEVEAYKTNHSRRGQSAA